MGVEYKYVWKIIKSDIYKYGDWSALIGSRNILFSFLMPSKCWHFFLQFAYLCITNYTKWSISYMNNLVFTTTIFMNLAIQWKESVQYFFHCGGKKEAPKVHTTCLFVLNILWTLITRLVVCTWNKY